MIPLTLSFGGKDLFVDLGAERPTLAAEKAGRRIAVEVQSFRGPSPVRRPRRGGRPVRNLPGDHASQRTRPTPLYGRVDPRIRWSAVGPIRPVHHRRAGCPAAGVRRRSKGGSSNGSSRAVSRDRAAADRGICELQALARPDRHRGDRRSAERPLRGHARRLGQSMSRPRLRRAVNIIDGKVWVQYDGTNRPIAEEFLEAGIPREDIVLGFHRPRSDRTPTSRSHDRSGPAGHPQVEEHRLRRPVRSRLHAAGYRPGKVALDSIPGTEQRSKHTTHTCIISCSIPKSPRFLPHFFYLQDASTSHFLERTYTGIRADSGSKAPSCITLKESAFS